MNKLQRFKLVLIFTIIIVTIIPQGTYAMVFLSQNQMNVPSEWAKTEINKAMEINLIPEGLQGEYRKSITREEFAELAVELYEAIGGKGATLQGENPFVDTQNPSTILANNLGIIQGLGDGTFAPYRNITREEVSVILYRTLRQAKPRFDYVDFDYIFRDYNLISSWAKNAVGYLYGIEVISGVGDDQFNPKGYTTREEAIALTKRMYDKVKDSERASRNTIAITRSSTSRRENPLIDKLKTLIPKQLGKPYRWAATGPNSFDCSGLTYYLYKQLGITIPRTSRDQINAGTYVAKKDLQYGDLVLFARNGKTINHVGIYVGDGKFIHSPQSGDVVKVTTLMSGYYANSYYSARRVISR